MKKLIFIATFIELVSNLALRARIMARPSLSRVSQSRGLDSMRNV
jgi:hypothetical protein